MELKLFRKNHKLSQSDLAELFGCSVGHISNIENGTRTLTAIQIRLLIDKYGFETVAKYAGDGEMPQGPIVNVDMHRNEIKNNQGPVQAGDGNTMTTDATLVAVMKQQSEQNSALIAELAKRSEQMDRLISLLEKK